MNRFKLLYFVIFIINLKTINTQISDKRLCVDKECSVPISYAKTLLRYSSPDSRILSFAPNVDITIYSKSAGLREDLWGGEINGKRGYIPKHMVRETRVLQKPTILVDTEFSNDTEAKQVPSQVEPGKVQEASEIIDGTTIYLNPQDNISPSSTESSIQSTALPVDSTNIEKDEITNPLLPSSEAQKENEANQESQEVDENIKGDAKTEQFLEENFDDGEGDVEGEEEETDDVDDDDVIINSSVSEPINNDQSSEDIHQRTLPTDSDSSTTLLNETSETNVEEKLNETSESSFVKEDNHGIDSIENKIEFESTDEPQIVKESTTEIEIDSDLTKTEKIKINLKSEVNNQETVPLDINLSETEPKSEYQETVPEDVEPGQPELKIENQDTIVLNSNPEQTEAKITNQETVPADLHSEQTEAKIENQETVSTDLNSEQTEQKIESQETVKVESNSEPENSKTVIDNILDNILPQSTDSVNSEEINKNEEPVLSITETTTLIPEVEVTPFLDDSFIQVTENPAEVPVVNSETSLPPLRLFNKPKEEAEEEIKLVEENISAEVSNIEIENLTEFSKSEISNTEFVSERDESLESPSPGFFDNILSLFSSKPEEESENELTSSHIVANHAEEYLPSSYKEQFCDGTKSEISGMDFFNFNSDIFLYLVTTAVSVIIFLFGYIAFDKSKREGPLIAKINKLEKDLLVIIKENQILQEKLTTDLGYETNDKVSSEVVENLKQDLVEIIERKNALEEQVQSLEKELENSTEVGMELNRMLSEILSSESGSDVLKANVEHLQRQLVEQQATINSVNETLAITNTENHELKLELELSNKKVVDLQAELDKLLLNILKIEEEKETQQASLETEIINLRQKYNEINNKFNLKENDFNIETKELISKLEQSERKLELKNKEYDILSETLKQLKVVKNDKAALKNLLEVSEIKAELQLLKTENKKFLEKIQSEQELKSSYEKRAQIALEELQQLKEKYDEADKLKVEMQTKLEVLSNYFKDREAQWQKEISKHEALWAEKEGEATSTSERIKFMQEQLQNYKAQTESLKQEIMSQEIELKSQISVLEKKVHENWVNARQAERKLEDAKQEAAQLRHRLTLIERAKEDKNQHRLQSPIEQNGDMPESPASPPLLYGTRDHITKSPPLSGLPPFLPPPPGVPFMPPPMPGVPPFIPPPPPNMFPGDHRPPPLGRMSSPPLNSRYSPSSRGYSPYDRNSSSPSDSEYGTSPPHRRAYSPFNSREDRRDYKRPPPARSNGRNLIKGGSSGSGHSNESLEKVRQQSKV